MNVTPNSFSDGGELCSPQKLRERLLSFGAIDALDIGAESTAPMNKSISWQEEWQRLAPFMDTLGSFNLPVSVDTYHSETIALVAEIWLKEKFSVPLIWNDVSGKFDQSVQNFLNLNKNWKYVFCHNLAPIREMSGEHMQFVSELQGNDFLNELASYFRPYIHPQVIFDPTLGFSKNYEQNWEILDHFGELQRKVGHDQWLLGFSRKSFLRKKLGILKLDAKNKEELDLYHGGVLAKIVSDIKGTLWVRTHRPQLISEIN